MMMNREMRDRLNSKGSGGSGGSGPPPNHPDQRGNQYAPREGSYRPNDNLGPPNGRPQNGPDGSQRPVNSRGNYEPMDNYNKDNYERMDNYSSGDPRARDDRQNRGASLGRGVDPMRRDQPPQGDPRNNPRNDPRNDPRQNPRQDPRQDPRYDPRNDPRRNDPRNQDPRNRDPRNQDPRNQDPRSVSVCSIVHFCLIASVPLS